MAVEDARPERGTDRASWINDPKVRGAVYQILLVLALALADLGNHRQHQDQPCTAQHGDRLGVSG